MGYYIEKFFKISLDKGHAPEVFPINLEELVDKFLGFHFNENNFIYYKCSAAVFGDTRWLRLDVIKTYIHLCTNYLLAAV